ncbi:DNA methyltransferase [Klebsiella pneumoniae]|nr:DNA methyltransferase [Klebsiella pneumoniae]MDV5727849.1 DNA methyltransferase [Klebsiella pneumoniae]
MAIRFLTEEGDLVVDPFSGSNKSGLAAERNNRRWIACDIILEHSAPRRKCSPALMDFG